MCIGYPTPEQVPARQLRMYVHYVVLDRSRAIDKLLNIVDNAVELIGLYNTERTIHAASKTKTYDWPEC